MSELGRFQRVDLRDIWKTEAQDFTPWLARQENLSELASALNIDLELEAQEKFVGPFRADILCKDTDDGSWVLVENQLERTDHIHLGQLLTYAAGLQAVTIVWIASTFTAEHRATLDWLNEITDEKFRFFGLEVELWRIGDSPAAPKFNVISKPNDWSRSVSAAARRIESEALTETKAAQLEFWSAFNQQLDATQSLISAKKPRPQHWMHYSVGRSGFGLGGLLDTRSQRIGVELFMNDDNAKSYFSALLVERSQIETELGEAPEWMELPDRKSCRIVLYWQDIDPLDSARRETYMNWMQEKLELFSRVFRPRIRDLEPVPE